MWLFGRVGESRVAGPGAARDDGRVWAIGWGAGEANLRSLPRRSPIRSCQQRFIVIFPRIVHVFVCTFCMGMLTWFLCRGHLETRIPHVLVLNQHWHAELDPELALRQPGLVNSACTRCVTS